MFDNHPSLAGMATICRVLVRQDTADPMTPRVIEQLRRDLPTCNKAGTSPDFYYWYIGTLAMQFGAGIDSDGWREWSAAVRRVLLETQRGGDDCQRGSWGPWVRWGAEGGRVYTTTLGAMTLMQVRDHGR